MTERFVVPLRDELPILLVCRSCFRSPPFGRIGSSPPTRVSISLYTRPLQLLSPRDRLSALSFDSPPLRFAPSNDASEVALECFARPKRRLGESSALSPTVRHTPLRRHECRRVIAASSAAPGSTPVVCARARQPITACSFTHRLRSSKASNPIGVAPIPSLFATSSFARPALASSPASVRGPSSGTTP